MGRLAEDPPVLITTKSVVVENVTCVKFASLDRTQMRGLSSESRILLTKHRTKKFNMFGHCLCAVRLVLRHAILGVSFCT